MKNRKKTLILIVLCNFILFISYMIFFYIPEKEIKLDDELLKVKVDSIFMLKDLNNEGWEKLYVIKPYQSSVINQRKISISDNLLRKIDQMSLTDVHCILLFTKESDIVNYSIVSRRIADFSTIDLNNEGMGLETKFILHADKKVSIK